MTAQPNPRPLFSANQEPSGLSYHGAPTRPLYWSVWREVWENHSIYIAPLIVAGIVLFGTLVGASHLPERRHNAMLLDPALRRAAIELPYDIAAIVLLVTTFIVGVFYCLDALYGERRDRSVLFWKSMPISDLTTVLAKATIPLLVLPAIIFVVIVATQFVMMLISTAALMSSGLAGTTWAHFNLFHQSLVLLYALVAIALWHAPIYGWLLFVSAWARRAAFLWATMPFFAAAVFEKITFNTGYVGAFLKQRLFGFAPGAFGFETHHNVAVDTLTQLTPGEYLSMPGLWLGLIFAVAFLAGAIQLRRYRGPI